MRPLDRRVLRRLLAPRPCLATTLVATSRTHLLTPAASNPGSVISPRVTRGDEHYAEHLAAIRRRKVVLGRSAGMRPADLRKCAAALGSNEQPFVSF